MKSIKKYIKKLFTIENIVLTILLIFIISITALGMVVKYYKPNHADKPENKYESVLPMPEIMDRSLIISLT